MIIFLGKGIIFWSGIAAALFFALSFFSCCSVLGCNPMRRCIKDSLRSKLALFHHYLIWLAGAAVALHVALTLLASNFSIYL